MEQVNNLAKTAFVQKAWQRRQVDIHGWVIDLATGFIKELPILLNGPNDLDPIFRYKL